MKIKYINRRTILALAIVTMLSSCLKDDNVQQDFTKLPPLVEIYDGTPNFDGAPNSISAAFVSSAQPITYNVPINYAYSSPSPGVTVTIAVDEVELARYNNVKGTSRVLLPANSYSIPNNKVTIPAGAQDVQLPIIFNSDKISISGSFALPLKITDASGTAISKNFASVVLLIAVKNQWDGIYSYSGSISRNSATGPDPALSGTFTNLKNVPLATTDANAVSLVPLWSTGVGAAGIDNTYITIDPVTNLVTVKSAGNASLKNTIGAVNKYDPATKTFTLAFDWGTAPNTRVTTLTLKYVGPRP
ncbi:DUF1735 domain-containing protein [Pedobacter sp. FW305-3-2-15-E-R2A2]|uniref:BT_3987 domain-containing protein n=1 Tax=Pedobacter sp. FW305-3-2-15-E-R2A2 TaxID=3140251 RepID=UPI00314057EF